MTIDIFEALQFDANARSKEGASAQTSAIGDLGTHASSHNVDGEGDTWRSQHLQVFTYNALLQALRRMQRVELAVEMLLFMEAERGVAPDETSYAIVIGACKEEDRQAEVERVLHALQSHCARAPGLITSAELYTHLITYFDEQRAPQRALRLFTQLLENALTPDARVFTAVLATLAHAGLGQNGVSYELLRYGVECGALADVVRLYGARDGDDAQAASALLDLRSFKKVAPAVLALRFCLHEVAAAAAVRAARDGTCAVRDGTHAARDGTYVARGRAAVRTATMMAAAGVDTEARQADITVTETGPTGRDWRRTGSGLGGSSGAAHTDAAFDDAAAATVRMIVADRTMAHARAERMLQSLVREMHAMELDFEIIEDEATKQVQVRLRDAFDAQRRFQPSNHIVGRVGGSRRNAALSSTKGPNSALEDGARGRLISQLREIIAQYDVDELDLLLDSLKVGLASPEVWEAYRLRRVDAQREKRRQALTAAGMAVPPELRPRPGPKSGPPQTAARGWGASRWPKPTPIGTVPWSTPRPTDSRPRDGVRRAPRSPSRTDPQSS